MIVSALEIYKKQEACEKLSTQACVDAFVNVCGQDDTQSWQRWLICMKYLHASIPLNFGDGIDSCWRATLGYTHTLGQ